jgi:2-haloacid dehalogenase
MVLAQNIFGVKALTFDVFGTTVDWRGSLIREAEEWGRARGLEINWPRFADSWRAGYAPAMDQVRKGLLPWMNLDQLHRKILDRLFAEYKIDGLSETEKEHFNKAWHRLHPWPDSVAGLTRLKTKFILSTLSNGNVSLLVEMAKFAGLPWDAVLCAEIFRHYKPDSETYLGARGDAWLQTAGSDDGGCPSQRSPSCTETGIANRLCPPPARTWRQKSRRHDGYGL